MHLFISFIMRAFMALLRDNLFVDGLDNLTVSMENLPETNAVDLFHPGTGGVSTFLIATMTSGIHLVKFGLNVYFSGSAS